MGTTYLPTYLPTYLGKSRRKNRKLFSAKKNSFFLIVRIFEHLKSLLLECRRRRRLRRLRRLRRTHELQNFMARGERTNTSKKREFLSNRFPTTRDTRL